MIELVSNLGFPIAMCLLMYSQMIKQNNQHQEEILSVKEAISNNTIALIKLSEKLDNAVRKEENNE